MAVQRSRKKSTHSHMHCLPVDAVSDRHSSIIPTTTQIVLEPIQTQNGNKTLSYFRLSKLLQYAINVVLASFTRSLQAPKLLFYRRHTIYEWNRRRKSIIFGFNRFLTLINSFVGTNKCIIRLKGGCSRHFITL